MSVIVTPTNTKRKNPVLAFDNLDDRREIYHLLRRLSPRERIAFMRWYLSHVHLGPWLSLVPAVREDTLQLAKQAMTDDAADEVLARELYNDIWATAAAYDGLSLELALNGLVERVKRKGRGKAR
jgi:hypothetical protein